MGMSKSTGFPWADSSDWAELLKDTNIKRLMGVVEGALQAGFPREKINGGYPFRASERVNGKLYTMAFAMSVGDTEKHLAAVGALIAMDSVHIELFNRVDPKRQKHSTIYQKLVELQERIEDSEVYRSYDEDKRKIVITR